MVGPMKWRSKDPKKRQNDSHRGEMNAFQMSTERKLIELQIKRRIEGEMPAREAHSLPKEGKLSTKPLEL